MTRRPRKTAPARKAKVTTGDNSVLHGAAILERIEQLARLSDDPAVLTRLYLNPAHKDAATRISDWMRACGMDVHMDALGTVIGRYAGVTADVPTLIIGSHIDTVRDAGRYDGTLGVLLGLAVVEHVAARGVRLPFAIEVAAFGDEEGVRFPGTLTGSRALAGRLDPSVLDETDRDGIKRRDALSAFGCDVGAIAQAARDPARVLGYLEAHIEQGPLLEAEGLPLGIVTAINGASRGRVVVKGEAGHSGTVPMALRRDALAGAADMILAIEALGRETPDLVATVGVVDVAHGAVNAVPGEVTFSLDVRSPSDAVRRDAIARIRAAAVDIATKRKLTARLDLTYDAPAAPCDPTLTNALEAAIRAVGGTPRRLASGAGHDAMSFKDVLPFAMLFVRCRGGISHNPLEHASLDDIDAAARAMIACIEHLAADDKGATA